MNIFDNCLSLIKKKKIDFIFKEMPKTKMYLSVNSKTTLCLYVILLYETYYLVIIEFAIKKN